MVHANKAQKNLCDAMCDGNVSILFQQEDGVGYRIRTEDGTLDVREYIVFPGVWLCYKEAHTQKYSYPSSYPEGMLEITFCSEGRFEYDAGDHFFYLSKSDMSISKSRGSGVSVYCPTAHYHGISVIVHPQYAPKCFSCFLEDVNVLPSALIEKFCGKDQYFLIRSASRLEHIFSELEQITDDMMYCGIQMGFFKIKILELLLFLSALDSGLSQEKNRSCSKEQSELAKQVCRFVGTHMDKRLTIKQLAAEFYVSPAKLKKCFYEVYGESIQAYIRSYKIRAAAQQLRSTEISVGEIAQNFGYNNASKFAQAFREVMGEVPAAYRKSMTDE